MDNKEILERASGKKSYVGEYETQGINKSNWASVIATGIVAVAFIIVFACLNMKEVCFAIGAICFTWASVFYFCQYFVAGRRFAGILIGAVLEALGVVAMITCFALTVVGVI
jgi:uncharacterized integral membrane protein